MQFIYNSRKCNIGEQTKTYAEKRLKKLEKFFTGDCVVNLVFTLEKEDRCRVEATANYGGLIFRAQEVSTDFKESIDRISDVLIRQIRKHKTKLEKRFRDSEFVFDAPDLPVEEDDAYEVIRTKSIAVKPMAVEEAILQMNLLAHDFYVFRNADTDAVNIVYRRKDGGYGLIETE